MRCKSFHRAVRTRLLLAATAMMSWTCPAVAAGTFAGKVVVVVDGDTIVVRDDRTVRHEIRLAGIDAPEIRQPYGVRSRGHLAELLYGKRVIVAWYKHDRYSRVLGRVMLPSGASCARPPCTIDAGWVQVTTGYAWHDRQHLDEQTVEDRVRYARAEHDARLRRLGLWAETQPMPPWRYRHLHPRVASRAGD